MIVFMGLLVVIVVGLGEIFAKQLAGIIAPGFELAERQERETEAEYEAWRLLLDQMKEADAAQASNLGQALVPAIAGRFQELTQPVQSR